MEEELRFLLSVIVGLLIVLHGGLEITKPLAQALSKGSKLTRTKKQERYPHDQEDLPDA
jgi:hypothetical protein